MTCIVGFINKEEGNVVIGGDSAGVSGLNIRNRKDVKVFKVDDFVIGCTSSFRMIQLLRFSFHPPKYHTDEDLYKYMCTSFVNAIRECFKNGGFAEKDKEAEAGGTFLVAYKDRLFHIMDDYQVAESYDDFSACGCGENYALGALAAMQGSEKNAEEKVRGALQIASYYSGGVRPPFIIEKTQTRHKTQCGTITV